MGIGSKNTTWFRLNPKTPKIHKLSSVSTTSGCVYCCLSMNNKDGDAGGHLQQKERRFSVFQDSSLFYSCEAACCSEASPDPDGINRPENMDQHWHFGIRDSH